MGKVLAVRHRRSLHRRFGADFIPPKQRGTQDDVEGGGIRQLHWLLPITFVSKLHHSQDMDIFLDEDESGKFLCRIAIADPFDSRS